MNLAFVGSKGTSPKTLRRRRAVAVITSFNPLSSSVLGNHAALAASTLRTQLEFSSSEPVAAPGLEVIYHLGTEPNPLLEDTDGDGVSDGAEWRQGSDPLDPDDFQPHDVIEVTVHFGDDSGSHSEKYEATITPVSGDTRPPIKLRNREFGEPDNLMVYLVSNAVYDVSLKHLATNEEAPDLDYTLSVSVSDSTSGMAALVIDPDELTGSHLDVPSSQFEKSVRIAVVRTRILADKNRDGVIDESDATPGPLQRLGQRVDVVAGVHRVLHPLHRHGQVPGEEVPVDAFTHPRHVRTCTERSRTVASPRSRPRS